VTDAGTGASAGTSTGTLTILVLDDTPVANDDTNSVTEDGSPNPVTGNVITTGPGADEVGADGAEVTFAEDANGAPLTIGTSFTSAYGWLTLNTDGSYSYTLDNNNAAVNALKTGETLTETFTYEITDGDGDTDTATLTITINGNTDAVWPVIEPVDTNGSGVTGHNTVNEGGLGDPADNSETTTGAINVSAPRKP
jgi:VCBS repeat-containing protein